jgi:hypothetical protein
MTISEMMKQPAAVVTVRSLFGAVVVYLFLVVLIVANAQQHVVTSLADGIDGENLSYGQAMFRYRAAESLRRDQGDVGAQLRKAEQVASAERDQFVAMDNSYEPRLQEVQDLATRLQGSGCAFDADSSTRPMELYRIIADCEGPNLRPQLALQVNQMQARQPAFPTLVESWRLEKRPPTPSRPWSTSWASNWSPSTPSWPIRRSATLSRPSPRPGPWTVPGIC